MSLAEMFCVSFDVALCIIVVRVIIAESAGVCSFCFAVINVAALTRIFIASLLRTHVESIKAFKF